MKKIYTTILLFVFSFCIQAQDDPNLLGQWFLHYIESNGTIAYPPSDGFNPTINFSTLTPNPFYSNADGDGVCNFFTIHYELPNSQTISIDEFTQTLIFCDNNNQEMYEFRYFSILNNQATNTFDYTINFTDETLTMIDLLGKKLVYGRQVLSTEDVIFSETTIKLYPNPVKETLSISGILIDASTTYSIYDLIGNTIVSKHSLQQNHVSVTSLKAGIYFLKVTQKGKTYRKKFIKI